MRPTATKKAPAPTILLVEDEMGIAQPVINTLLEAGFGCHWAPSIREARAALQERQVDLLLLDRTLETDGLDFFQGLRTSKQEPEGGVIALIDKHDTRNRERAHQLGAAAVVTKPIQADELIRTVREMATCLNLGGIPLDGLDPPPMLGMAS